MQSLLEYQKRVALNPKECPNCRSHDVRIVKATGFTVSGDRKCSACSCVWTPAWGWASALVAVLVFVPVGALLIAGAVLPILTAGGSELVGAGSVFAGAIGLMLLAFGGYGFGVLLGRCGKAKVHFLGKASAQPDAFLGLQCANPQCGRLVRVPRNSLGRRIQCPSCHQVMQTKEKDE